MPFIRQTRDKRGFEQTYVMHAYHPAGNAPQRPRVLYVFRSPANLKVGRTALDAEVMEALEHTHPDLSFDWTTITRDPAAARVEIPGGRQTRRRQGREVERRERPAPAPAEPLPPDDSLLGRVAGAAEAARLRRRYAELLQRIGRRARTPEERDRLLEGARRLNPEDWPDDATIRARMPGVEAAWDALAAELPSRRRGRRGGRRRPDQPAASGIMAEEPAKTEGIDEHGQDDSEPAPGPGGDPAGGDRDAVGAAAAGDDLPDPEIPFGD